ncbi:TPA: tail fiber protein [Escherichia coli]|nr:tail fiber protein [Escherichia coli]
MHRIDTKTAQKDKFGAGKNGFTRGNPQTGTPATDLDDDYFDMLQEELCSVVEASGASLEKARHDQLLTALRALLLSRKNPFGDIKSDGTVKTALENLGLGEGAPAIGVPFFWPSAAMPNTVIDSWSSMVFLKFNGATFSASTYPKLALVIPSLTLPDARGEFPRIWDDGRGVDAGRAIFSAQGDAIRNIVGSIHALGGDSGAFYYSRTPATGSWVHWSADTATHDVMTSGFDASRVVPTASENRPRNIAFNFLVRAK